MNTKIQGAFAVLLSAFLFGATPILGRISYSGGSNSLMLTLLRAALALPVLFGILLVLRIPLRLDRRTFQNVFMLATFGSTASMLLFYISFLFIPVGLASVINCTYPFFVVLFSALVLKEKMSRTSLLALVMVMVGVFLFIDPSEGDVSIPGIFIALLSGVCYAFVLVFQAKSNLFELHPLKLSFWQCIFTTVETGIIALCCGQFTLSLTPGAWASSLGVAVGASVLALSLTQFGLVRVGSSAASILSMLQPITSVVLGVLLLHEPMSPLKLVGGVLILIAVMALTYSMGYRQETEPTSVN